MIIIDPMIVVMSSNNKLEKMAGIYSMAKQHRNKGAAGKQDKGEKDADDSRSHGESNSMIDDGEGTFKRLSSRTNGRIKRKGKLNRKVAAQSIKQSFENEIEMIEESLFKISKLLMLCYGEAGATIVSKMI